MRYIHKKKPSNESLFLTNIKYYATYYIQKQLQIYKIILQF